MSERRFAAHRGACRPWPPPWRICRRASTSRCRATCTRARSSSTCCTSAPSTISISPRSGAFPPLRRSVDGPHRVPGSVSSRNEFPKRPVPAVGAIVFRDGAWLLVKRCAVPSKGRWSLPGGALEIGETVEAAAVRETLEETAVDVRSVRVFDVRDFIQLEGTKVRWHYVLIDVLCEHIGGEPFPGTDAENARFVPLRELGEYDVAPTALEVLEAASAARIATGESISP